MRACVDIVNKLEPSNDQGYPDTQQSDEVGVQFDPDIRKHRSLVGSSTALFAFRTILRNAVQSAPGASSAQREELEPRTNQVWPPLFQPTSVTFKVTGTTRIAIVQSQ